MISYPPNLIHSEKSYSEAFNNAIEIGDALDSLLAQQRKTETPEPLHSLFSSRRKILLSELKALSGVTHNQSGGFSLN